jgi:hypothetical protein
MTLVREVHFELEGWQPVRMFRMKCLFSEMTGGRCRLNAKSKRPSKENNALG